MTGNALVALGQRERGLELTRRARRLESVAPMLLYNVACIYSMAACPDEAIDCLDACFKNGFSNIEWAEHDSNLDAIRDDSRYLALMERARSAVRTTN